jgi:hypothetical protein
MNLPERQPFSTGEAIGLSSPSGRMSKRARKAALRRLEVALFGEGGIAAAIAPQPLPQLSERELLIAQAERLEALADRGMCVRKYRKLAAEYRTKAVSA